IDQMDLEALGLELARDPTPARRRLDRDRGQLPLPLHRPNHRASRAMARTGSRSARPSPDQAPPPETPDCEYRSLRTTSAGASLLEEVRPRTYRGPWRPPPLHPHEFCRP